MAKAKNIFILIFIVSTMFYVSACSLMSSDPEKKYYSIYLINNDGTNKVQITKKGTQYSNPIFFCSGNKLAFDSKSYYYNTSDKTTNSDIFISDKSGVTINKIISSASEEFYPQFSTDNTKIAFVKDTTGLAVIDLNTAAVTEITNSIGYINSFQWSPDGTKIAFDADVAVSGAYQGNYAIYSVNADGTNLTKLADNGSFPKWSKNGQKIAFQATTEGLYIMDVAGGNKTLISSTGKHPEWSPSNLKIVYDYETSTCNYIRVINVDGTSSKNVTEGSSKQYSLPISGYPKWSKNGQILFAKNANSNPMIMVVNEDGSNLKEINQGRSSQWSPDGTQIVFYSEE